VAFPTTPILDTANRPNEGPPPSVNWGNIGNGWSVTGNQLRPSVNAVNNLSYWNMQFKASQEAIATVATLSGPVGVFARMREPGAGTDFYLVRMTTTAIVISRIDNSTETVLSTTSVSSTSGMKIGIRCIGAKIQAWRDSGGGWALVATTTDSTYPNGGYIGLFATATAAAVDDFGGGNSNLPYDQSGIVSYGVNTF